ncbi:MAG: hypothetical protein WA913_03140, partial [Pricia sp.]
RDAGSGKREAGSGETGREQKPKISSIEKMLLRFHEKQLVFMNADYYLKLTMKNNYSSVQIMKNAYLFAVCE